MTFLKRSLYYKIYDKNFSEDLLLSPKEVPLRRGWFKISKIKIKNLKEPASPKKGLFYFMEKNILDTIGNTPLVEIKKLSPKKEVKIFAKLEGFNPTGSIKDRIALFMIKKAEKEGVLKKGKVIIEPTSGNTGISLAMIGAVKGYKVVVVMPETMTEERKKIIKTFGAKLILVKKEDWRDAAIKFTKKLQKKHKNYVFLNQYENPANFLAHYYGTAKEILRDLKNKKIDYFVAGIGTGGTITGVAKRLKKNFKNIKIIGVLPKINEEIQGLKNFKEGYKPPILDLSLIDEIVEVSENLQKIWQKSLLKLREFLQDLLLEQLFLSVKKSLKK